MGFLEVLANIFKILGFIKQCKKDVVAYQPDVLILIDYGGFNMRMAKFAKEKSIKTFYYISPKIWAWNQKRANKIKATVDRMFVILPFEEDFYKRFDYEVDYVGNPLLDATRNFQPNTDFISDNKFGTKPVIAVLPGSRKQEITHMLDSMIEIVSRFKEYEFVIAGVDNLPSSFYEDARKHGIKVIYDQTYDLLSQSHAALVTSGTATLETALFEVPQVVCYKSSWLSYQIGKRVIQIGYISLVNLIVNRPVVKELIQNEFTIDNLSSELRAILEPATNRQFVLDGYKELKSILGDEKASENTAKLMVNYLKNS